ncbi:MAG: hypothetical protein ABSE82_07470 [Nitrososphaerales archaeon]
MADDSGIQDYVQAIEHNKDLEGQRNQELPNAIGAGAMGMVNAATAQQKYAQDKRSELFKEFVKANVIYGPDGKPVDPLDLHDSFVKTGQLPQGLTVKPIKAPAKRYTQRTALDGTVTTTEETDPTTGEALTSANKIDKLPMTSTDAASAAGLKTKAQEEAKMQVKTEYGVQTSDDQLKTLATMVALGVGKVPQFGLGANPTRDRYNAIYADVEKSLGVGGMAGQQAQFAASKLSLDNITKQKDVVMAFENTAMKNMDLAQQLSAKVGRTDIALLNKAIIAGDKSLAGDVDSVNFCAAVITAKNEYARVTSSVTGGGITSDTAKEEANSLFNACQSPDQIIGVIKTLKQEMENRRSGYNDQIDEINLRFGQIGKSQPTTTPNVPTASVVGQNGQVGGAQQPPIYHTATNAAKQKIKVVSTDGGKTWSPVPTPQVPQPQVGQVQ